MASDIPEASTGQTDGIFTSELGFEKKYLNVLSKKK
jgi:hypothetical protein